jgi:hypothetical protein
VVWRPSGSTSLGLSILSIFVALAAAYGALVVAFGGSASRRLTIALGDVVLTVVILTVALLAHEGVHGLAISTYGGKPRFGWSVVARILPTLYCVATGQRFSRVRYAIVAVAPSVFVSLALIIGLRSTYGGPFVIPFAIHLGVCTTDWVVAFRALREPQGSLIEDVPGGILVHPPASRA